MNKKNYYLIKEKDVEKILRKLNAVYGYPSVYKKLSIFFNIAKYEELHLNISNRKITLIYIDSKINEKNVIGSLDIANIEVVCRFLYSLNLNVCKIGIIDEFKYFQGGDVEISFLFDSFIGNLLETNCKDTIFINELSYTQITSDIFKELVQKNNEHEDYLINEFNTLNPKILNYAKSAGIHIKGSTISECTNSFSNDYSNIEIIFKKISGFDLLTRTPSYDENIPIPSCSVIIPYYLSEKTIYYVLDSIEKQNLPFSYIKNNLEVIIINDASIDFNQLFFKEYIKKLSYQVQVVTLSVNKGRSAARNLGASVASNEFLIFLDSDIILESNYLSEHLMRLICIPNAIFVSFKQNLELSQVHNFTKMKRIKKPSFFDDLRISRFQNKTDRGIVNFTGSCFLKILNDSNYFKDFSFGRSFGVYNLGTMLISHNFSIRKKTFDLLGGFSKEFKGWGLEDTFFGMAAITNGLFLIPVLSTGVYHINHDAREGSDNKNKDFENNLSVFKKLVNTTLK